MNNMKRFLISIFLIAALCFVAGCGKEEAKKKNDAASENSKVVTGEAKGKDASKKEKAQKEPDYEKEYAKVLSDTYDFIVNAQDLTPEDGEIGIWEMAMGAKEDAVNQIAYTFKDINGDNVKELIIGCFNPNEYAYSNNEIYAIYTLENGKPKFILEGRSRNFYALTKDDKLFHTGSSGAAYSGFGMFYLSKDNEVKCIDYYFTYPTEDYSDIEYFYNTTGIDEKEKAEKQDITEEEFYRIRDEYADTTAKLKGTTFNNMPQNLKGEQEEKEVPKSADLMEGTWVLVSGQTDGDEFLAETAGLESELTIEKNSHNELYADYRLQSDVKYQSFTGVAEEKDMSLYDGCGNDKWCVEFVLDSSSFGDDEEFYATLTDEDTLLMQHFFPFDGATGVSYLTYIRK